MLGRSSLFSRTGLSNLLNKIQFTFEVASWAFSDNFFTGVHQFKPSVTRGWVGAGRGGGRGGSRKNPPGEDTGPPVTPRWS